MAGKRAIEKASERVKADIEDLAGVRGGIYGRGLASEGYAGGYYAALQDVLLALRGVAPCNRPGYWRDTFGG